VQSSAFFAVGDHRSRWRLLRSGRLGRRRRSDRGHRGNAASRPTVHRRLELYCTMPTHLAGYHGLRHCDTGVGWQSHGAPWTKSAVGSSYLIQKQNRGPIWTLHQRVGNSFIGIKGTEPIGGNVSVVFALDAGFDRIPCNSRMDRDQLPRARRPQNLQSSYSDSSRRASGTTAKAMSASVLRPMAH